MKTKGKNMTAGVAIGMAAGITLGALGAVTLPAVQNSKTYRRAKKNIKKGADKAINSVESFLDSMPCRFH